MKKEKQKFYDLKARKKFTTDKYEVFTKKNPRTNLNIRMAKAQSPYSNIQSYRILGAKKPTTKKTTKKATKKTTKKKSKK